LATPPDGAECAEQQRGVCRGDLELIGAIEVGEFEVAE